MNEISTIEKNTGAPKVLITGASSGIGMATARLFTRGGYEVYAISRNIKTESKKGKNGERYRSFPMDVTNDDSVKRAVKKIGYVDILILAVHDLGNGGDGYTRQLGDVFDGHGKHCPFYVCEPNFLICEIKISDTRTILPAAGINLYRINK